MRASTAASLVGAAILSTMLFPLTGLKLREGRAGIGAERRARLRHVSLVARRVPDDVPVRRAIVLVQREPVSKRALVSKRRPFTTM